MIGEGSKSFPILILDDEDGDIEHPRQMASTSFCKPHQQAFRQGLPGLPPRPVMTAQPGTSIAQRAQNSGAVNPDVLRKPKRKREQSNQSLDITAPSSSTSPGSITVRNMAQNGAKSKKVKHSHRGRAAARRRIAEELEFQSLPGPSPVYSSYPYNFDLCPVEQDIGYGSTPPENDIHPQSPYADEDDMHEPRLSSSDWVNSMARAADPLSPEFEPESWDHDPSIPWPAPTQPYDHGPSQTFSFPLPLPLPLPLPPPPPPPPPPVTLALPVLSSPPVPPPLPSILPIPMPAVASNANADNKPTATAAPTVLRKIIGMPSDRDPDGKRSGFKISSNTIFQSQPHVIYPHTPTRSNAIIMEQLPKQNRDPEFIMSWGEKAAGSAPIFLAVDPGSAKALVEFGSHAIARKAWSSPKLGKHLSGLPSTDLKGKPREDLIRVWWYKPSPPDLVFSRLELEEGEIEDEAPAESLVKKETKKERKARLAKLVREEKEKRKETAIHAAALLEQEKLAARRTAAVDPPSFAPPALYSLPYTGLPALYGQYQPHSESPGPGPSLQTVIDENGMHRDEMIKIDEADLFLFDAIEETTSFQPEDNLVLPSSIFSDTAFSNLALSPASKTLISPTFEPQIKSSRMGTPPVTPPSLSAPSEPRAMKNAPKAPTFTKRALLARQKELEARIARSKLELLQRTERIQEVKANSPAFEDIQQPYHRPVSSSPPTEEEPNPPSTPKDTVSVVSPKLVRENHLRNLVLASRRQKATAVSGDDDAPLKVVTASNSLTDSKPDASCSVKAVVQSAAPSASTPSSSVPGSPAVQTSLDDLAASFIAETIQTLKPVSGQSVTPLAISQAANYKPSSSSPAILAARQKQLEDQIAESKRLMEKLTRATTKQEKDTIMASIRELSWSPNVNGSPQSTSLPDAAAPKLPVPPAQANSTTIKPVQCIDLKCMWPAESPLGGGIVILSDDEDEDE